jgi:putative tricarboxylic transport membrane protein
MSEDVNAPADSGRRGLIRNPQDFYGGLALVALAVFALWASGDLPGMRGFSFGPGTAPRLFAGVLLAFGVIIAGMGLVTDGKPLERYAVRGPLWITISIIIFATTVRPLGLIIATFVSFVVSGAGSPETRWVETIIAGVVMTAFSVLLFVYLLNLPFQLWPRF